MPHHTLLRKPFWNQSESEEGGIKCGALDKVPPTLSLSCPPEGTLRPCLDVGEYERAPKLPNTQGSRKIYVRQEGPKASLSFTWHMQVIWPWAQLLAEHLYLTPLWPRPGLSQTSSQRPFLE